MNNFIISLLVTSTILFIGCKNKTNETISDTNNDLTSEPNDLLDGAKQIGQVYEFEFEFDGDDLPAGIQGLIEKYAGQEGEADVQVIVNGEVIRDMKQMPIHIKNMMDGHDNPEMMREMKRRMMGMNEGHGHPEMMREMHHHMIDMNDEHEHMMRGEEGEWHGHHDDISEEQEFMHKVRLYAEVAAHLAEPDAVALLGIHMIRDQVEHEKRLEILDEIIDQTPDASPARNGAILVAIETCNELEQGSEAASYMAELVISNTMDWYGEHEHDDYDGD